MPGASFGGLRVLSLESRRSVEVAKLIRTYGGEPLTAPAMREIPTDSNQPILEFAEALMRGAFDLVIFTTGVGVRSLVKIVSEHYDREAFLTALRSVKIAARGPKSSARSVNSRFQSPWSLQNLSPGAPSWLPSKQRWALHCTA